MLGQHHCFPRVFKLKLSLSLGPFCFLLNSTDLYLYRLCAVSLASPLSYATRSALVILLVSSFGFLQEESREDNGLSGAGERAAGEAAPGEREDPEAEPGERMMAASASRMLLTCKNNNNV